MIHALLTGSLAAMRDDLARLETRTPVCWMVPPVASNESGKVDVRLRLAREEDERQQLPDAAKRFSACWQSCPATASEADHALQDALEDAYGFVVGYSEQMHEVCRWVRTASHVAATALNLKTLIVGETGVGKELVASAIHRLGPRGQAPFVALNCGALSRELAASELFGHVRGSFTDAKRDRTGVLLSAGDGVVFLDEVGETHPQVQVQLLRALEQQEVVPVGSDKPRPFRAQVIAATNAEIERDIQEGRFRADLYFRLAQTVVQLPPLRERRADVPLLARSFAKKADVEPLELADEVWCEFTHGRWPGNVRQLRSLVELLTVQRQSGHALTRESIPQLANVELGAPEPEPPKTLAELRSDFDRSVLLAVLTKHSGDTVKTAEELSITRRAVYDLVKKHGIDLAELRDE